MIEIPVLLVCHVPTNITEAGSNSALENTTGNK
jgi:hypothetical protein